MESVQLLLESQLKPHHSPFLLAQEKNYYEDRDLEVELIEPESLDGSYDSLLKGKVDYILSRPTNLITSFLNEKNVVSISRFFNTHVGVLFRKDTVDGLSDITSEHNVVCNGLSIRWATFILEFMKSQSNDSQKSNEESKFNINIADGDPIESMINDQVDVIIPAGVNPEGVQCEQAEFDVDFWFFDDFSIPSADDLVIVTTSEKTNNQPNSVQNFIHATHDSVQTIEEEPDQARDVIEDNYSEILEQSGSNPLLYTSLSELTSEFSQDYQNYTAWGEFFTENSDLSGFVDVDRLTDERFIPLESVSF